MMSAFSYHEIKEPTRETGVSREGSGFDRSITQDFKMGPFVTVVSEKYFGGPEDNCEPWQPVIVTVLHDIKERLEAKKIPASLAGVGDVFEVNEPTLQLLCNKNVEIILVDNEGNKLLLQKIPFMRDVPPQGSVADIGTRVRINATVILVGESMPAEPTTWGDVLIPDQYLDMATSSPS